MAAMLPGPVVDQAPYMPVLGDTPKLIVSVSQMSRSFVCVMVGVRLLNTETLHEIVVGHPEGSVNEYVMMCGLAAMTKGAIPAQICVPVNGFPLTKVSIIVHVPSATVGKFSHGISTHM